MVLGQLNFLKLLIASWLGTRMSLFLGDTQTSI